MTKPIRVSSPKFQRLQEILKNRRLNEKDFKWLLRDFKLNIGLSKLGQVSCIIANSNTGQLGALHLDEHDTNITQFILAYMANVLIISGATDQKKRILQEGDILTLSQAYFDLMHPAYDEILEGLSRDEAFLTLFLPFYYQQFRYTKGDFVHYFARSILLFREILLKQNDPIALSLVNEFEAITGISLDNYLAIGLCILSITKRDQTFQTSNLIGKIDGFESFLNEETLSKFLSITSMDYDKFKKIDKQFNSHLKDKPEHTMSRFNPLWSYPIIKTQEPLGQCHYVVPNSNIYLYSIFGEIYWKLFSHYQKQDPKKGVSIFTSRYGKYMFEPYVGLLLEKIFPGRVKAGTIYKRKNREGKKTDAEFSDWYIEDDEQIYLIQCKGQRFFQSQTIPDYDVILKEIKRTVIGAYKQIDERFKDLHELDEKTESPLYPELNLYKNKKLISIVVFDDVPYVSTSFMKNTAKTYCANNNIKFTINTDEVFLLNIDNLEQFQSAMLSINFETILQNNINQEDKLFNSFIEFNSPEIKAKFNSINYQSTELFGRNPYLQEVFDNHYVNNFRNKAKSD